MSYNFVVFECLVSLGILAFVWFYLFARLRRDNFRSEIRMIRDGLFDFMWKNGYSFDEPAYRETRQMLNGIIRLGNTLSPMSWFAAAYMVVLAEEAGHKSPAHSELPKGPLGEELKRVRELAFHITLQFVFLSGIFGLFVRGWFYLFRTVRLTIRLKEFLSRKTTEFLEAAYLMGRPDFPNCNSRRMARIGS
jgi:hypothetical protein